MSKPTAKVGGADLKYVKRHASGRCAYHAYILPKSDVLTMLAKHTAWLQPCGATALNMLLIEVARLASCCSNPQRQSPPQDSAPDSAREEACHLTNKLTPTTSTHRLGTL